MNAGAAAVVRASAQTSTTPRHQEAILWGIVATAVLTAFDSPSACRLDCTVPRCGDGVLDGGEICDDGNNAGGDGCGPTCTSLQ